MFEICDNRFFKLILIKHALVRIPIVLNGVVPKSSIFSTSDRIYQMCYCCRKLDFQRADARADAREPLIG